MVAFNNKVNHVVSKEFSENWSKNLINSIEEDGIWTVPRSGSVFRVEHSKKRLVLLSGDTEFGSDFQVIRTVFEDIGWDVIKEKEQ